MWYDQPILRRAPAGGLVGVDGVFRKGGEFEPFYIPREVMPQIDEKDYPALLDFATTRGVQWSRALLNPREVRPHQRISINKAIHMDPETLTKPILASVEPMILDGNHRWYQHNLRGSAVPAFQFALPFEEAIRFLFDFPGTYYYGDGAYHPISH